MLFDSMRLSLVCEGLDWWRTISNASLEVVEFEIVGCQRLSQSLNTSSNLDIHMVHPDPNSVSMVCDSMPTLHNQPNLLLSPLSL